MKRQHVGLKKKNTGTEKKGAHMQVIEEVAQSKARLTSIKLSIQLNKFKSGNMSGIWPQLQIDSQSAKQLQRLLLYLSVHANLQQPFKDQQTLSRYLNESSLKLTFPCQQPQELEIPAVSAQRGCIEGLCPTALLVPQASLLPLCLGSCGRACLSSMYLQQFILHTDIDQ